MPIYILMAYVLYRLAAPTWCWIVYGMACVLWALCTGIRLVEKK